MVIAGLVLVGLAAAFVGGLGYAYSAFVTTPRPWARPLMIGGAVVNLLCGIALVYAVSEAPVTVLAALTTVTAGDNTALSLGGWLSR